jgi:hypothetical protein
MLTIFITLLSFCFNNSPIEKILPPINNIYKTNVNIPLIGNQNIEYERTKYYVSEVRLDGLINAKGNVYIDKNNIYDYTFDEILKNIIKKYKCELNNPYYNFEDDVIVIEIKIKLLKFGKKLILVNNKQ